MKNNTHGKDAFSKDFIEKNFFKTGFAPSDNLNQGFLYWARSLSHYLCQPYKEKEIIA
ncbi:MAG TPA: hypothetical protein PK339_01630 [Flavitalea sp.]|nr:hypothetical protein [Flavitalea sp.]